MEDEPVHERLRRAREARGEDVAAIARRIGVSPRLLHAIEEGRFGDLPGGIYARTSIRRYGAALSFDPEEILGACDPFLPSAEDLVTALARLQGLRPAPVPKPPAPVRPASPPEAGSGPTPCPAWRPLAAVAIDGLMVAALLLAAVAGTIPMSGSGASSLGRSAAPVFGLMGLILGSCYFVFFGGIACATAGERLIGMRVGRRNPRHIDPRTVAARALRCTGRDVRYILSLGAWTSTVIWSGSSGEGSEPTPSIGHATGQEAPRRPRFIPRSGENVTVEISR